MSHNITKALPGLGVAPGAAAGRSPCRPTPPAEALARDRQPAPPGCGRPVRRGWQGKETAGEGSSPSDVAGDGQMARVNSRTATTTAATATRKKNIATFAALAITLIQA